MEDAPGLGDVDYVPAQDDLGFFAGTPAGRVFLSVLVAALTFTLVIWNLPDDSKVRDEIRPHLERPVRALAIDQSWGVFAPNPTRTSVYVSADVTLASGEVVVHEFPDGDDLVGAYRQFRWRKWESRVRLDRNRHMWDDAAEWVARTYAADDVAKVSLVRTFSTTPEPGSDETRTWQTTTFCTLRLDGSEYSEDETEC